MKAAIYCRVSTHDQREEGTSLETQRAQCLARAQSLGWDAAEEHIILEAGKGITMCNFKIYDDQGSWVSGDTVAHVKEKAEKLGFTTNIWPKLVQRPKLVQINW